MHRLTRRQAIAGGTTLIAGAGFVGWGRFALGGTFEDHVADVLGLDGAVTREILERLRDNRGLEYNARASAFLLATTEPSRSLMPSGVRRQAVESFVLPFLEETDQPSFTLAYAGLRRTSVFAPCRVLVRS
jgi:hypothetical protein